jgi:integrase
MLDFKSKKITLPDTKTGKYKKLITKKLRKELIDYTKKIDYDDFVFYPKIDEDKKSRYIRERITKRILKSNFFQVSNEYAFCVHMFRTTRARRKFEKCLKYAKEKTRKLLGHKNDSKATLNYLDNYNEY